MDRSDFVVIGGGVIGLAVARAAAMAGREVLVVDANDRIGAETSSRNSGVIHAGLYYPAGSLMARACVDGRRRLYAFCEERGSSVAASWWWRWTRPTPLVWTKSPPAPKRTAWTTCAASALPNSPPWSPPCEAARPCSRLRQASSTVTATCWRCRGRRRPTGPAWRCVPPSRAAG